MPRAQTPTVVATLPARTTRWAAWVLAKRLEAARQLYNAALQESLRRLARLRADPAWAAARALPKGTAGTARSAAFGAVRTAHGFSDRALHAGPTRLRSACADSWLMGHLDANTAQTVITRAFRAVEQYAFGGKGRPRFKRAGELTSVEGKTQKQGILLRQREGGSWVVRWTAAHHGTLEIALVPDPRPCYGPALKIATARVRRMQANARKWSPARVAGSRS